MDNDKQNMPKNTKNIAQKSAFGLAKWTRKGKMYYFK
jgi:hypothetical protein